MPITTINIGSAPNDNTGNTIRDSFDICNDNFQDLDTTKYDIPAGTISQYVRGDGTLATLPSGGAATQMNTQGRNSTGVTLYKGTIVYISGSTGNLPNFVKAQANSEATSAGTFGVVVADIANNADGYVCTIGTIDNLDTRSSATNPFTSDTLVDGDTIYLSPTTAGYITRVKPYAPNHIVYIGKVVRTSPTNGTIVYRIQNGYELDEIHDVAAQTPSNNDGLFFETATSLWKNKTIANVLGYTPQEELFDFYSKKGFIFWEDFLGDSLNSTTEGWGVSTRISAGAGTITSNNTFPNRNYQQGVVAMSSNANPGSQCVIRVGAYNNAAGTFFGNGKVIFETYINVETLSTSGERFLLHVGYSSSIAVNTTTCYQFIYDEGGTSTNGGAASPNWKCCTFNGTTRTNTDTGIAVGASVWYRLRIEVNANNTGVDFYINGTLVASHTTGVGINGGSPKIVFTKTAGTTNRNVYVDYIGMAQTFTNQR